MARNLADLQAALQKDILEGKTETLPRLSVPKGSSPEKRLFVYQNAYIMRLVEILSEDFDTTWTFLGDEMFYDLAQRFVRECPSNTPNARWFSHRFPEFLETQEINAQVPAIAEIARIERALSDAFDAKDARVFERSDLEKAAQSGIEDAVLSFHPSMTLIRLNTNAYDIFKALRSEAAPPAPANMDAPRWCLVWRRDLTCRHMEVEAEQGALLDLAQAGHGFTKLCEFSATLGNPDTAAIRMAQYLGSWIENEMVTDFR